MLNQKWTVPRPFLYIHFFNKRKEVRAQSRMLDVMFLRWWNYEEYHFLLCDTVRYNVTEISEKCNSSTFLVFDFAFCFTPKLRTLEFLWDVAEILCLAARKTMFHISECCEISEPETFSDLLVAYPIVVKVVNAINLYPTDRCNHCR